jgi:glyoxylase-like metal-dependent hydrolase (beta-lactamase superfamily II)
VPAQASYLLTDSGEAAVIDPRRDVDDLVARLLAEGLTLRWIVETHLHADFVSGHHELAAKTGATIVFGKAAGATFEHRAVGDGDTLPLGSTTLEVLETPGHTPESICLVAVEGGLPKAVFTGDTLFVGDVGRPDLVGCGRSAEEMASLSSTACTEAPHAARRRPRVPGARAGSPLRQEHQQETSSTIGKERRFNVSLQPMSKESFVKMATTNLPEVPRTSGATSRSTAAARALSPSCPRPALPPAAVSARVSQGALVLDIRPATEFAAATCPAP